LIKKKQKIKVALNANACGTEKNCASCFVTPYSVMHLRWFFSFAGRATQPRTRPATVSSILFMPQFKNGL
jgi:hypothetical protein